MAKALALWLALTVLGLAIGIAGYAGFESMSLVDAYVNAAMILSGMGPLGQLHTTGGKIFAGSYAIFSGLVIVIATSFVLGADLPPGSASLSRGTGGARRLRGRSAPKACASRARGRPIRLFVRRRKRIIFLPRTRLPRLQSQANA